MKPITPKEVLAAKAAMMPEEVLAAFNELIVAYWDGHSSTVTLDEALACIIAKMRAHGDEKTTPEDLLDHSWLDVEPIYRKVGWVVTFTHSDEEYFTFEKRPSKSPKKAQSPALPVVAS